MIPVVLAGLVCGVLLLIGLVFMSIPLVNVLAAIVYGLVLLLGFLLVDLGSPAGWKWRRPSVATAPRRLPRLRAGLSNPKLPPSGSDPKEAAWKAAGEGAQNERSPLSTNRSELAALAINLACDKAGAEALLCVEEIEWTIVDVSDMVEEAEIALVLRERWESKWHCSLRQQVEHERKDADKITKTTT